MIYTINHIAQAATSIIQEIGIAKIVCFEADMGSGKTTLIAEICKQLGVIDIPSSPTYSIINEYKTRDNKIIYHLDLYRVKDEEEAIQAGVEDVLYSGNLCFIEWPNVAKELLPDNYLTIYIKLVDATTREIKIEKK